ncbi:TetR/AcrR family transcriptional regulator [Nocardia jiangxiensis]|uniref:TetR/AcrR family transcriptional regulator n=1 Tax=Nocardia jiangxiensis TaxID=282685 RepID=A0ABW6RWS2_9NOCA|nr:TetR/AcrR family transcriptional regulator [Nocardia jiangxiensis]
MVTRTESAAATRRALLDAAAELLDSGGPDAVTLRAVGARAGLTRGAPYRHFPDKDSLLTTVATEALDRLADQVRTVCADPEASTADRLRRALAELVTLGRRQPHLYRLMFESPLGDPATVHAATLAGERAEAEFFTRIEDLVGHRRAPHFAALLLAGVHGITAMESSGHLSKDKWQVTADELVATLVSMIAREASSQGAG